MTRLRDHVQAFARGLKAWRSGGSVGGGGGAVLKRVEVDDEGICVTVTLARKGAGHPTGLTLIFEVRAAAAV